MEVTTPCSHSRDCSCSSPWRAAAALVGLVVLTVIGPVLIVALLVAGLPLLVLGGVVWAAVHAI